MDLLNETKGFKYQLPLNVLLKKNTNLMEKLNLASSFQFNNKNSDKSQI